MTPFDAIFETATQTRPYPFQCRFAESTNLYGLVNVPTGLGKTAMAVLGWVWRRRFADENVRSPTPRRLVYCLPMRVLVEQTRDAVQGWLQNLELTRAVRVTVLMGGEEPDDWDLYPEHEAIVIGTQDMLLSRALNRGYGLSRARWPLAFGLLNTDCLWVFDEIQLMGSGLATTAQLDSFRRLFPRSDVSQSETRHECGSVWMSATMQRDWLKTVDFDPSPLRVLKLEEDDLARKEIRQRYKASKPLSRTRASASAEEELAAQILKEHNNTKGRTLVVVNTVKRARRLFDAILKHTRPPLKRTTPKEAEEGAVSEITDLVLLHSRFRPHDRTAKVNKLLAEPGPDGTICISTQVVEAGVDVSATTLFTELAPWGSLVQRFGRCNRQGNDANARVFWIDIELPEDEKKADEAARPYAPNGLREARKRLLKCSDVGLSGLPTGELLFEHTHVIRRKDLIDLFDTTPDLAGNDIDIDRYIREAEDTDLRVFWREWPGDRPPDDPQWRRVGREEFCHAAVSEFREFVNHKRGLVWRWDFLDGNWVPVDRNNVYPGQTYLAHTEAGGYTSGRGWDSNSTQKVAPLNTASTLSPLPAEESTDDEPLSQTGRWQTIAQHTDEVCNELDSILPAIPLDDTEGRALRQAARWHDWGKAHEVFCMTLPDGAPTQVDFWAKAAGKWKKYARRHFRHELASALGVLGLGDDYVSADLRDLVAYVVAAHHGKVRLSIRSLPGERRPANGLRFARGVWDGDQLPTVDLGGGVIAPAGVLSLEPIELGYSSDGKASWMQRAVLLRDRLGPFRLAFLEALLRAADMRASAQAVTENNL